MVPGLFINNNSDCISSTVAMRTMNIIIKRWRHNNVATIISRRTFFAQISSRGTRASAIQSFFAQIEIKYNNLSQLLDSPTTPAAETIVSSDGELHIEHLVRLFTHDATAIHVPNYYHKRTATKLGMELLHESRQENGEGGRNWKVSTSRGLESSDVITLGKHTPYNVAVAAASARRSGSSNEDEGNTNKSKDGTDDYFEGVHKEFRSRRIRKQVTTNDLVNYDDDDDDDNGDYYRLWPLDKLRLELEEIWPGGAGLAREDDTTKGQRRRPFGGGLPRIMIGPTRWKRGFVHVDELGPLKTERGLFSANIYLTMPPTTATTTPADLGALYIWPLSVRTRWDWYRVS